MVAWGDQSECVNLQGIALSKGCCTRALDKVLNTLNPNLAKNHVRQSIIRLGVEGNNNHVVSLWDLQQLIAVPRWISAGSSEHSCLYNFSVDFPNLTDAYAVMLPRNASLSCKLSKLPRIAPVERIAFPERALLES